MNKLSSHIIPKILILFLLITFTSSGCKKSNFDNKEDPDKISNEVRAALNGEIVFARDLSIYKSNAKSGGLGSLISANTDGSAGVKWSPDGSKVAFIRYKVSDSNWYLVICGKDGAEQHEWPISPFNALRGITWSPDGYTIAALTADGIKIVYIDVATGVLTVTELVVEPGYIYSSIAWWPDGSKIAIAESRSSIFSNNDGNKYIWMLEAFENDPQKDPNSLLVTNNDPAIFRIEYMDWSMDGSRLVYSDSGISPIYIVNSDGTGSQEIILNATPSKNLDGFGPCWMSNNNQIIFTGVTGLNGTSLIFGLFVTNIHGDYEVDLNIPGEYPDCY